MPRQQLTRLQDSQTSTALRIEPSVLKKGLSGRLIKRLTFSALNRAELEESGQITRSSD